MSAMFGRSDGPWMTLDCSTRFREKRREVRLHCEGGVAVLPDADSAFLEILRPGPPPDAVPELDRRPLEGDPPLRAELAVFVRALQGLSDAARIRTAPDRSSLWAGLFDLRENLLGRTLDDLRALAAT
jgi:hypothetical protein